MKTKCLHRDGFCVNCGLEIRANELRFCRKPSDMGLKNERSKTKKNRLVGDQLENLFSTVGITPDNYKYAKELMGLLPTCNCGQRKEIFNRVHEYAKEHGWIRALIQARRIAEEVNRESSKQQGDEA